MIVIGTVIGITLVVILSFMLFAQKKTEIITIDINPSIELNIVNGKVKEVKALTEDGREFTREEWQGMKLEEYLDQMVKRVIELHLDEKQEITLILGTNKNTKKIKNSIKKAFQKKSISS